MKASSYGASGPVLDALRARAAGRGVIGFAEFMEVALYDPAVGYYRSERPRVGYGRGTDFLTATASAPLLGRLVAEAAAGILGRGALAEHEFVEIGAEPGGGVLGAEHPFRSARTVGAGQPLRLAGPSVVFSNELFDAQPFRRFRCQGGGWWELGVALGPDTLAEVALAAVPPGTLGLPAEAPEGYVVDAPAAAAALARRVAAQPWHGLFVALDYGKTWSELVTACPEGTARAYRRHAQGGELLAHAGDQDLTCHVCWDWIGDALASAGFGPAQLESQEAFFVHHAGEFLAAYARGEAARFSRGKLSLLQLLHPANLGQSFQALWAVRPRERIPLPAPPAAR